MNELKVVWLQFFNSALAGAETRSELNEHIYDLILELNRVASPVLLSVLPQLEIKIKVYKKIFY